jgi:hypothetical protein
MYIRTIIRTTNKHREGNPLSFNLPQKGGLTWHLRKNKKTI